VIRRSGSPGGRPLRLLAIFAGGTIGGAVRLLTDRAISAEGGFPLDTFLVNVAGAALLGFLLPRLLIHARHDALIGFVAVGLLGSLTTFSTMAVESALLADDGRWALGAAYVGASVLAGLGAAWLGMIAEGRTR
jgi:CrcB protein